LAWSLGSTATTTTRVYAPKLDVRRRPVSYPNATCPDIRRSWYVIDSADGIAELVMAAPEGGKLAASGRSGGCVDTVSDMMTSRRLGLESTLCL